jgi:hypothetical protein
MLLTMNINAKGIPFVVRELLKSNSLPLTCSIFNDNPDINCKTFRVGYTENSYRFININIDRSLVKNSEIIVTMQHPELDYVDAVTFHIIPANNLALLGKCEHMRKTSKMNTERSGYLLLPNYTICNGLYFYVYISYIIPNGHVNQRMFNINDAIKELNAVILK